MAQKKTKRSERAKDTWNEITGIMSIYGNTFENRHGDEYISWSATVGKKDEDGDYQNYYFKVRFAKNATEPMTDGLHQIDIQSAFISLESYEKKNKEIIIPIIVITEDEVLDEAAPKTAKKKKKKKDDEDEDDEDEDDEDDLPF